MAEELTRSLWATETHKKLMRILEVNSSKQKQYVTNPQRRLRWFGHGKRMDANRLPTKVNGKRNKGRQSKTWMDNIKEDLKARNMDITAAAEVTRDREKWRWIVQSHCRQI